MSQDWGNSQMKLKETFVCSLLLVASCANNPHLLPQASLNFLSQNPPSSLSDIQESALCNEHLVFTVQFKHQSKTGCPYCQCQCGSTVNTSTGTSASADITSEHPPHDLCHLLILGKVDQMRCRGLENKLTDVLARRQFPSRNCTEQHPALAFKCFCCKPLTPSPVLQQNSFLYLNSVQRSTVQNSDSNLKGLRI